MNRQTSNLLLGLYFIIFSNGLASAAELCPPKQNMRISSFIERRDPVNMSIYDILKLYKKGDPVIIGYIKGIADGFTWGGAALRADRQQELFCEPNNVSFDGDFSIRVIQNYVNERSWKNDVVDICASAPMVILQAFKRAFPCAKEK